MGSRGAAGPSLSRLETMAKDAGYDSYGQAYQRFTSANPGIKPNAKNMEKWLANRATREADRNERQYEKINNRANEIASRLDRDDYKSPAERDKLIAEYEKLNNQRMAITRDNFYRRNTKVSSTNKGRVIQVLDGNRNVKFEGYFDGYQDYVRSGKMKDDYSTRVVRK